MLATGSILVVDDSRALCEVMNTLLVPHCRRVLTASSLRQALECLRSQPGVELILCDVALDDGDGFELLQWTQSFPDPRREVILLASHWVPDHAQRAAALGATGYLTKPISLRDIRMCRERVSPSSFPGKRIRRRTLAKAWLVEDRDGRENLISWDLHNVSTSGAFLETKGPLPIDSELNLEIPLGADTIRATAQVVRVQQPSWMHVGGVGVRFVRVDQSSESLLERFVEGELGVWADVMFAAEPDPAQGPGTREAKSTHEPEG